jgi:hypothetical protein
VLRECLVLLTLAEPVPFGHTKSRSSSPSRRPLRHSEWRSTPSRS